MQRLSLRILQLVVLAGFLAAISGCTPQTYQDTVNPSYITFGVRRVAVVVWCSGYTAEDPALTNIPALSPSSTPLKRYDDWDKELTPRIAQEVCRQLTRLGYDATDQTASVKFAPEAYTEDAIKTLRQSSPAPDAVLMVSYMVSKFRYTAGGRQDPYASSAFQQTRTDTYDSRYVHAYATQTRIGGASSEVGGVHLRGVFAMFHLKDGQVMWQISGGPPYVTYSQPAAGGNQSDSALLDAVTTHFGGDYATPAPNRHGLPHQ